MSERLVAAPIGVFDSGVGGLSVLANMTALLPYESYIYYADTLHVPYGSRSSDEIRELTIRAVDFLAKQGCKLVVIACNTASAYGLDAVRAMYPDLPMVGLVPALKPAVLASKTKQVAVLATPATLNGRLLNEIIDNIATPNHVNVHKHSLASLVPWVEAGMPETHLAVTELEELLKQLHQNQIDQLVLGCTHFPFFKPYLMNKLTTMAMDYELAMIDSGLAIAKRVKSLLDKDNAKNPAEVHMPVQFFTTSNQLNTQSVVTRLLSQFDKNVQMNFCNI